MATQYPLHRASFRYKLSMRHQLNRLPIYAKPFVAQYSPNTQAKHSLQSFRLTLALIQSQPFKLKTLAALKVKLQHTAALIIDACTRVNAYQFCGTYGKGYDCLEDDADNDIINNNKNIKTLTKHYKTSNKPPLDYSIPVQACDPHGYWAAGRALFNLNTQITAANDNEWRVAA